MTVGFCCVDVNPAGPVHEYPVYKPAPPEGVAVRFSVVDAQTGELLPIATDGTPLLNTVILVLLTDVHPLASVTVRLYVPPWFTEVMVNPAGLATEEVKPDGPLQA